MARFLSVSGVRHLAVLLLVMGCARSASGQAPTRPGVTEGDAVFHDVTFASGEAVTVGVSVSCCDVARLALVGEITTATPLAIVTDAEAEVPPETA